MLFVHRRMTLLRVGRSAAVDETPPGIWGGSISGELYQWPLYRGVWGLSVVTTVLFLFCHFLLWLCQGGASPGEIEYRAGVGW